MAAVTITGDMTANFGLCSALGAFEQGGIFIVPHLLRHGTSVYMVSSERPEPTSHSGIRTPTQGSSDHCARRSTQAIFTLYVNKKMNTFSSLMELFIGILTASFTSRQKCQKHCSKCHQVVQSIHSRKTWVRQLRRGLHIRFIRLKDLCTDEEVVGMVRESPKDNICLENCSSGTVFTYVIKEV
jgi:hypothetical protein